MALTPSLTPYGSNPIATGEIVQAPHVYQFVRAFAGIEAYNIFISGGLSVTGSTDLSGSLHVLGIPTATQTNVLGIDSNGRVYIMSTSSLVPPAGTGSGGGGILGFGVNNYLAIWSGSSYLTASSIYRDPTTGFYGIGTTSPTNLLTISGSLGVTGSTNLSGSLTVNGLANNNATASFVLGIDPVTGQVTITSVSNLSGSVSGSTLLPAGIDYDVQLKLGNQLTVAGLGRGFYSNSNGSWTFGERVSTAGSWSFATGKNNIASGYNSFVEGNSNQALGSSSHAAGEFTTASGEASFAEGLGTLAQGDASHAAGLQTKALGSRSWVNGNNTVASGSDQTVIGKFNELGNLTDIFVIGSGSTTASRLDLATFGNIIKFNRHTFVSASFAVSGSTLLSGSINAIGLPLQPQFRVLAIDASGNVTLMNTASITTGGGSGSGGGNLWSFSGVDNYFAIFSGSNGLTTASVMYNDEANRRIGVGTITPTKTLEVSGSFGSSGSSWFSGSVNIIGPPVLPQTFVLAVDPFGNVVLMNTASIAQGNSSASLLPAGNDWDIQLRSGSVLAVARTGIGAYNDDKASWTFGSRGVISASVQIGSWSFTENYQNIAIGDQSSAKGYKTIAVDLADTTEGYLSRTADDSLTNLNLNFVYSGSSNLLVATQPGNYVSTLTNLGWMAGSGLSNWYFNVIDQTWYESIIVSMSYNPTTTLTELLILNNLGSVDLTGAGFVMFQRYSSLLQGDAIANHAEGYNTKAYGMASHAEGKNTIASNQGSHAEGFDTIASGTGSHAEGRNTVASGDESHAEGSNTLASGISAHSENYGSTASGDFTHAEGWYNWAKGNYSHAEGKESIAHGEGSHVEGLQTIASGSYSHNEGFQTYTSNSFSHAEGWGNFALGQSSHAEGKSNLISYLDSGSHVEGNINLIGKDQYYQATFDLVFGSLNFYDAPTRNLFIDGDVTATFSAGDFVYWFHADLQRFFKSLIQSLVYSVAANITVITFTSDPTGIVNDTFSVTTVNPGIYTFLPTQYNHVEGQANLIKQSNYNHVGGTLNEINGALGSNFVRGIGNIVNEGEGNTVLGQGITLSGSYNIANGTGHFILGSSNLFTGTSNRTLNIFANNNVLHGSSNTIAGGGTNVIEGSGNYITGSNIHVGGANNSASADYTFLFGEGLRTRTRDHVVFGTYNKNTSSLFTIGNGNVGNTSDIVNITTTQVQISGSTFITGSNLGIVGIAQQSQSRVLGIDSSGNVTIMNTSSFAITGSSITGSGVLACLTSSFSASISSSAVQGIGVTRSLSYPTGLVGTGDKIIIDASYTPLSDIPEGPGSGSAVIVYIGPAAGTSVFLYAFISGSGTYMSASTTKIHSHVELVVEGVNSVKATGYVDILRGYNTGSSTNANLVTATRYYRPTGFINMTITATNTFYTEFTRFFATPGPTVFSASMEEFTVEWLKHV
jgi:hypothetical protein